MRRILGYIPIALLLLTGVAVAGPHGGGGGGVVVRDHRSMGGGGGGGVVVRDHRSYGGGYGGGGVVVRDHRGGYPTGGTVVRGGGYIRPVGGRYVFPGGVVRVYNRPVIREHYYSYWHRPALIVENYEPVPGYVWIRGNWTWNGVEWVWGPGYWQPAAPAVGVSVGASVVVD